MASQYGKAIHKGLDAYFAKRAAAGAGSVAKRGYWGSRPVFTGAVGGAAYGGLSAYNNDESVLGGAAWGAAKGALGGAAWKGLRAGGWADSRLRKIQFGNLGQNYAAGRAAVSRPVQALEKMANDAGILNRRYGKGR